MQLGHKGACLDAAGDINAKLDQLIEQVAVLAELGELKLCRNAYISAIRLCLPLSAVYLLFGCSLRNDRC